MKALQGQDGRPTLIECAPPVCEAGQVRIRVVAAGLNRADLLQAAGLYPPPQVSAIFWVWNVLA